MERGHKDRCLDSPEMLRLSSSPEPEPRGSSPNIPDFDEELWQGLEEVGQELDRFAQEVSLVTHPEQKHGEDWTIRRNQENNSLHDIKIQKSFSPDDKLCKVMPESTYHIAPPSQGSSRLRVKDLNQMKASEILRVPPPPPLPSFNTVHQVKERMLEPSWTNNTVENISKEEKICEVKALQSLRERLIGKVKKLVLHKKNLYAQRCRIVTTTSLSNNTRAEKILQKNSQLSKEIERKIFSIKTHIHLISQKISGTKKDFDCVPMHGREDDIDYLMREGNKRTNTSRTLLMSSERNYLNKKRSLGNTGNSRKRTKYEVSGEEIEASGHIINSPHVSNGSKIRNHSPGKDEPLQATSNKYAGSKAQTKIARIQAMSSEAYYYQSQTNGGHLHATSSDVCVGRTDDVCTQRDYTRGGEHQVHSNDGPAQTTKEIVKTLTPTPASNIQDPLERSREDPEARQVKNILINHGEKSSPDKGGMEETGSQSLPASNMPKSTSPKVSQVEQTVARKEENSPLNQSEKAAAAAASSEKDSGGEPNTTKKPPTPDQQLAHQPADDIVKHYPVKDNDAVDPNNVEKGKEKPLQNHVTTTATTSPEKGDCGGSSGGDAETGKKSTTVAEGEGGRGNLNKDLSTHWCQICNVFFTNTLCYIKHLHSAAHIDKIEDTTVKTNARNLPGPGVEAKPDEGPGKQALLALGVEFLRCGQLFVCELCEVIMWDVEEAAAHPTTQQHLSTYKEYVQKNTNKEMEFVHAKMEAFAEYCNGRMSRCKGSSTQSNMDAH